VLAAHAAQVVIASPHDNGRFPAEISHALNSWNGVRTPVALLGPQIWAVTVINHGSSLVAGLTASGR
jgi:hypothetical protein